ncbi:hypothetical protein WDM22_22605 [Bradyrhizobium septentrionale]|uniref:hypothetical protein n=1 Tax=Bradyrhizobium septentrionale TaxID=1404411 RepID=UPI0030D18DA9
MRGNIWAITFAALVLDCSASFCQTPELLLYGGSDHKTFLGCLNCSSFSSESACNEFGQVGSQFASDSIWNQFGHFGSKFSSDSPWNQFSSSGPVIVDKSGNFYGRVTANQFISDRTRIDALNRLTDAVANGLELDKARDQFCGR